MACACLMASGPAGGPERAVVGWPAAQLAASDWRRLIAVQGRLAGDRCLRHQVDNSSNR